MRQRVLTKNQAVTIAYQHHHLNKHLSQFAAERKKGGEFYTPRCIVWL
jgi:type I restriction-modification system DNA methylase subunit